MDKLRIIFWGTPEIAVPFLERLCSLDEVVAVVTRPDALAGRDYRIKIPPIKIFAKQKGIKIFQPEKLKDENFIAELKALSPELGLVVSYGKIIPEAVLKIPKLGFINIHFSLLPKYRGAAPIQWAIIKGEKKTAVTAFWLDSGLDTGPIILQKEIEILPEDNYPTLQEKLISLGIEAMEEALVLVKQGIAPKIFQQGESSFAPPLKKDDGKIDWNQPAETIVNLIRGTYPWPGAFTFFKNVKEEMKLIKIISAKVWKQSFATPPGQVVAIDKGQGFVVNSNVEAVLITMVQSAGKKEISAWDFWQGVRIRIGDVLGGII